ncbi:NACHT domain-containing protein [Acinetobacter baumannii]|nr:NACHT domain-containing protein [Acinetobacter baumannii]MDC4628934.1 NACHT domain-containing protein [Acinetobacter baumannii]
MSLTATASLATVMILRPALSEVFKIISPYLVQKTKGSYLKFNLEKALINIENRLENIFKVKTIYESKHAVHISQFYYPTKVYIGDHPETINNITELSVGKHIVFEGTIGHGKSMFMRHLTLNEVLSQKSLPIFFELRKLNKDESILEAICSNLTDLFDIEINENDFFHLARNGALTLFLDGVDEISDIDSLNSTIRYLESWAVRFPEMYIICSSRPDSAIQNSAYFFPIRISNYDNNDQQGFLHKLTNDIDVTKQLIEKISSSSIDMQDLLRTPLMLTFFLKTYEVKLKIPLSLSDFYSDLFDVLMNRHDILKAPFKRERFIDVEDSVLQDIFEEFCLYTKQNGNKLTFPKSYFKEGLEEGLKELGISIDPNNLIKEFTKNICLILQDGNDYSFIHKSIQEFFVANLIKSFDVDPLSTFYNDMRCTVKSNEYIVELIFLKELDKLNYFKYYLIPSLEFFISFYDSKNKDKIHFIDGISMAYETKNPEKLLLVINFPYDFINNCSYIYRNHISKFIISLMIHKDTPVFNKIITCDTSDMEHDVEEEYTIDEKLTRSIRQFIQVNSLNMHLIESIKQELDEANAFMATKSRTLYKVRR